MYKKKDPRPGANKHLDPVGSGQTIEVEAPTVEAAIKQALQTLHAKKKEVTIEVLKEEHKGLFGMEGAEPARIKATLKSQK